MASFGEQLLGALRAAKATGIIIRELGYDEIQEFKCADREQVVKMMQGVVDYETLQHLKADSPEEFAAFAKRRGELEWEAIRSQSGSNWFFWFTLFGMMRF